MSAALFALLIAMPSVLADSDLSATTIDAVGDAELHADLQAVFAYLTQPGLFWQASAASATIERNYLDRYSVGSLYDGTVLPPEWKAETVNLDDVQLVGTDGRERGALYATGTASAIVKSAAGFRLAHTADPVIEGEKADLRTGEGDRMRIHEELDGSYIVTRATTGVVEVVGTLTVEIRDLDYEAQTAEGTTSFRSGRYMTQDVGGTGTGTSRVEYHTLTLTDAVLRIELTQPVDLYSRTAELALSGQLLADGVAVPGVLASATAPLRLGSAGGLLVASAPGPVETQGARLAVGPSLALPLGALGMLALAVVVALAARRPRKDDVAEALIAMGERRWEVALPRLTRALRARPDDAKLLLDRALCLEMLGKHANAARAYESALRRAPRSAEAHFYLARTLAKLQNAEPGVVHLQAALELDPRLGEMARADPAFRTLGVSR